MFAPGEKNTIPSYNVLIVDDEQANLNLLYRTFRKDYNLFLAENGIDGLAILKKEHIDAIISDQRMPKMSGVEMLSKSRQILPHAVRIILTAYTDVRDIIAAINEGSIYRYILKPWQADELRTVVGQAMDHYNLERENRDLIIKLQKSLDDLRNAQQELVARERLSTIGRVASSVIHDLKLPMSNIRTSAALLKKPDLDDNLRAEFSAIIMKEVDRLIEMTREILEYSRGESKFEMVEFDVNELLDEIINQIRPEFRRNNVDVVNKSESTGVYSGDPGRLHRVLLNLAINARDAMQGGGVLTFESFVDDEQWRLRLSDTGPGIPAEIIENLFDPFVTHGKHDGTGLGLAIVRRIIEGHGGTIRAENRPAGGAVFELVLPRNHDE